MKEKGFFVNSRESVNNIREMEQKLQIKSKFYLQNVTQRKKTLSNINIFKEFLDNGDSQLIICDGIKFSENFNDISRKLWHITPKDFDFLFIDNDISNFDLYFVLKKIVVEKDIFIVKSNKINISSYIVTRRGVEKYMNHITKFGYGNLEHDIKYLTRRGLLNCYCWYSKEKLVKTFK